MLLFQTTKFDTRVLLTLVSEANYSDILYMNIGIIGDL